MDVKTDIVKAVNDIIAVADKITKDFDVKFMQDTADRVAKYNTRIKMSDKQYQILQRIYDNFVLKQQSSKPSLADALAAPRQEPAPTHTPAPDQAQATAQAQPQAPAQSSGGAYMDYDRAIRSYAVNNSGKTTVSISQENIDYLMDSFCGEMKKLISTAAEMGFLHEMLEGCSLRYVNAGEKERLESTQQQPSM